MSRRSLILLGVITLLIALVFVPRIVHHAKTPDFEPGVPLRRRPQIRIEGLSLERPVGNGVLELRAAGAAPGHERLGPLALGPSTFLELTGVQVTYTAKTGKSFRARADLGELGLSKLELTEGATLIRSNEKERSCSGLLIDLSTGRVTLK